MSKKTILQTDPSVVHTKDALEVQDIVNKVPATDTGKTKPKEA